MIIADNLLCERPLVSIVVLTYNQENYISQTIDSILSQKCDFDFELIIGEDCGTDQTRSICIQYQKDNPARIKLLLHDFNGGLIRNFSELMSLCRGKYIAHCAGDDYWCDDLKLKKQIDFFNENPDYGFVRTGFYCLYPETNILKIGTTHSDAAGEVFQIAKYGPVAASATICFKKELLQYVDFDEFINRRFSIEDYPMQAIMSKHTKFGYIPDITAVFRQTKNSGSRPSNYRSQMVYFKGYIAAKLYLSELFPGEIEYDERIARNFLLHKELKYAFENLNYKQARQIIRKIENPTEKEKKLLRFTNNVVVFYLGSFYRKIMKLL